MTLRFDDQTITTPLPANPTACDWYASIIMSNAWPSVWHEHSYERAMAPLRDWYRTHLADLHPEDRRDTIAEFGTPATTTVERLNDLFSNGDSAYWMDIVPVADVLPRILATMADHWTGPTAIATLDGCIDVVPYPTADAAEAALRAQAQEWGLDDPTINPPTATIDDLCAAYARNTDQAWIGLVPIITTGGQRLALLPLDHLPSDA